jgi:hypothetical protein
MSESTPLTCIACSVFRPELEVLQERGQIEFPIVYLDSNLHMQPRQLREQLEEFIQRERKEHRRVLLLFGDCHAYMVDQSSYPGVTRVPGANCSEMLLGPETYRRFLKERVFFLLPEWTLRWKEILATILDLDRASTIEMMRDRHLKFIYLDTGAIPVPEEEIRACSEYFGMPSKVLQVSLDHFTSQIRETVQELERRSIS